MDFFLLFFAIAALVLFLIINAKMVFHFEDNDAEWKEFFGLRIVLILAFTLSYLVIFLLPIDVRNSRQDGGLDMELFWTLAFSLVVAFIIFILPCAMIFMETKGDAQIVFKQGGTGRRTFIQMVFFFFFVLTFLLISFSILAVAKLPLQDIACGTWIDADEEISSEDICQTGTDRFLEINVRFDIYLIAVLCFLGWWLFVVFGGIGLTALPMDLIIGYLDRPQPISVSQYASRKILYAQTAEALLSRAAHLQERDNELKGATGWKNRRKIRALQTDYNKFKQSVHLLDSEFEHMEICMKQRGENPVIAAAKCGVGILLGLASLLWILHILLYMLILSDEGHPTTTFLNAILTEFESADLFVLAAISFALLNLHLLFCTVKGCLKIGMRAFCLFSIHPMKKGRTPLNSMMFNSILILFTSCAIVQFSQQAFRDYARATTSDMLFNAQIRYLKFYKFFFDNDVFVILLLIWCFLCLCYLIVYPRDRPAIQIGDQKKEKNFFAILGKKEEKLDKV